MSNSNYGTSIRYYNVTYSNAVDGDCYGEKGEVYIISDADGNGSYRVVVIGGGNITRALPYQKKEEPIPPAIKKVYRKLALE